MLLHNLFLIFIRKLNQLDIQYMVTGSVASIIYGEPRITHDVDIVVEITVDDAQKIFRHFPINEFYCPPIDILTIEAKRLHRGHFNLIHHETGFKADIYIAGNDDFAKWALKNTYDLYLEGEKVKIAPIEYVIIKKLEYYKEGKAQKHVVDIVNILKLSKDRINLNILKKYINKYSLKKEWEECLIE